MQITSKFTIAIHIITATEYFKKDYKVTSGFLAKSVGANPVVIRTIITALKNANILDISQGKTGISLKKGINEISFYEVYKAIDCEDKEGLFHFHEQPNKHCPIGKNIHSSLDDKLLKVQNAMENEMEKITIKDVYDDIIKEIGE